MTLSLLEPAKSAVIVERSTLFDVRTLTGAGPISTCTTPLRQVMRTRHSLPAQSATALSRLAFLSGLFGSSFTIPQPVIVMSASAQIAAVARGSFRSTPTVWRAAVQDVGTAVGQPPPPAD
ncbi:MAG: hypothetical protein QOE31_2032 [Solirubrobacteraceae bacterium]|jgi:hypothetical protein|nr:hypothetical protein [Solirubrobacteraceae bacterium]